MRLLGRIGALILGALLVVFGLVLSATIIGSVVGIPCIIIGALLMICALVVRRRRPYERLRL